MNEKTFNAYKNYYNDESNVSINVNINDYMYGIVHYYYYIKKENDDDDNVRYCVDSLFIHCIDMVDLYNEFLMNHNPNLYKELYHIDKNMSSFIKNAYICRYTIDKLISKSISHKQLSDRLIAFIKK